MHCPHCETEVDEHEANRCLDAWVAIAIFGWMNVKMGRDDYGGQPMPEERNVFGELLIWKPSPHYSTDIAAAWEVVERIREPNGQSLNGIIKFCEELAVASDATQDDWMADTFNMLNGINPLAICRAALKASV